MKYEKVCNGCQEKKSVLDFPRDKAKRDGRATRCKKCKAKKTAEWREAHPDRERKIYKYSSEKTNQYTFRNILKIKAWFQEYKSALKCEICGESTTVCLDFHHLVKSDKSANVTWLVNRGYSRERILEEAAKCMVVCANCHRKIEAGLLS